MSIKDKTAEGLRGIADLIQTNKDHQKRTGQKVTQKTEKDLKLEEHAKALKEEGVDENALVFSDDDDKITLRKEFVENSLIDYLDVDRTIMDVIKARDSQGNVRIRRTANEKEKKLLNEMIFNPEGAIIEYQISDVLTISFKTTGPKRTREFSEYLSDLNYNNVTMNRLTSMAMMGSKLYQIKLKDNSDDENAKDKVLDFSSMSATEVMTYFDEKLSDPLIDKYIGFYSRFISETNRILSYENIQNF